MNNLRFVQLDGFSRSKNHQTLQLKSLTILPTYNRNIVKYYLCCKYIEYSVKRIENKLNKNLLVKRSFNFYLCIILFTCHGVL
jgi:hypothetical protein